MPVYNLFSKRQKILRGEIPSIYIYDKLPTAFRVQIIHIIKDTIGRNRGHYSMTSHNATTAYEFLHKTIAKEMGKFTLSNSRENDANALVNFFLKTDSFDEAIDIIELTFRYIDKIINNNYYLYAENAIVETKPEDAIAELNQRFKEHGIGYQYEAGEIIRIDSTFIHSEIVKPVIALLWNKKFIGANEEYLKAHEHYKGGRNKECLNECLKAFESVMKIICSEKKWQYSQTDTAKKLIQICFQNELVPTFTQNQFTSLQNLLESGIPTIRNKLGGHGQGALPQKVDDGMTRYALNLTGTNIIFLIEQSNIV